MMWFERYRRPVPAQIWTAALLLIVTALGAAPQALADSSGGVPPVDAGDPGWSQCRSAADEVGRAAGLPDSLLPAIAVTETGIRGIGRSESAPWPWTINVRGQGYRFATKAEAVDAVRTFRRSGVESIDVGCMQVNLKYHPRAFTSVEEALDPTANTAYAAQFLAHLHALHGEWRVAVRAYHSHDPDSGAAYGAKIDRFWAQEKDRAERVRKDQRAARASRLAALDERRSARVLASLGTPVAAAFSGSDETVTASLGAATRPAGTRRALAKDLKRTVALTGPVETASTGAPNLILVPSTHLGGSSRTLHRAASLFFAVPSLSATPAARAQQAAVLIR